MASIALEGVSRVYAGDVRAVDGVDLEVRDREFFVLVGPSGCGKTTTLRLIAGFEPATAGSIRIGDRVVDGLPPRSRDLAMVVQGSALYPHLSVRGNLAFGARLHDGSWWRRLWLRLFDPGYASALAVRSRSRSDRVNEVARLLGIDRLLTRRPAELSGGERQRVALGRALVRKPAALLLDEPLSSLDAPLRVELRRELKRLQQRTATTILFVTHDQVEALTLGERIAVMDRGIIHQVGTPQEIYEQPRNRFVAGFIGSPPMNFAHGRLKRAEVNDDSSWFFECDNWRMAIGEAAPQGARSPDSREVLIGIRPENLRVAETSRLRTKDGDQVGKLAATVEEIESHGDSLVVRFAAGADHPGGTGTMEIESGKRVAESTGTHASLVARLAAATQLAIGQTVMLDVDVRRLHWFDPRTGENVGLDEGAGFESVSNANSAHTERDVTARECRP